MLTIRKQNFESQPCFCCSGVKANYSDPKYAVVYQLYHTLPDSNSHLPAKVVVPRCKFCAEKMKPVWPLTLGVSTIGALGGFFYGFSDSGIVLSLLCAAVWFVGSFVCSLLAINYAFKIVYGQRESAYEIVEVMRNEFGWRTDEPKQGDSDVTFNNRALDHMLYILETKYECEFADID